MAQIIEDRGVQGTHQRHEVLPAGELLPLLGKNGPVPQRAVIPVLPPDLARYLRPLLQPFATGLLLPHRHNQGLFDLSHRALRVRIKLPYRVDRVAKELDAQGAERPSGRAIGQAGGVDVDDAPP